MSRFPMPTEQDWEQYRKEQEHDASVAACEATANVPECIDRLRWTIVEIVRVVFEELAMCVAVLLLAFEGWSFYLTAHCGLQPSATATAIVIVAGTIYFVLLILAYRIGRLR